MKCLKVDGCLSTQMAVAITRTVRLFGILSRTIVYSFSLVKDTRWRVESNRSTLIWGLPAATLGSPAWEAPDANAGSLPR